MPIHRAFEIESLSTDEFGSLDYSVMGQMFASQIARARLETLVKIPHLDQATAETLQTAAAASLGSKPILAAGWDLVQTFGLEPPLLGE